MEIAVASGKGGTGKTFLATNLFRMMERSGLDVCLADCDAEVPNSSIFIRKDLLGGWDTRTMCPEIDLTRCTFCGSCAESCRFHAITCVGAARYIRLSAEGCHGCGACILACSQEAVGRSWKKVGRVNAYGDGERVRLLEGRMAPGQKSPVPVIRETVERAEALRPDFLILDAPPGCSCPFIHTVMSADLVLLVTEPTPFGLSDLRHTVQVLRQMDRRFGVVINRAGLGTGAVRDYLEREGIRLWAEIPYDEGIAGLYAQGEFAVDHDEGLQRIFRQLMEKMEEYHEDSHSQR